MEKNKYTRDRSFYKIVKCIKSCDKNVQLETCKNMISNYESMFCKLNIDKDVDMLRDLVRERRKEITAILIELDA